MRRLRFVKGDKRVCVKLRLETADNTIHYVSKSTELTIQCNVSKSTEPTIQYNVSKSQDLILRARRTASVELQAVLRVILALS